MREKHHGLEKEHIEAMKNIINQCRKKKCSNELCEEIYPYYGVAPHGHNIAKTGSFIGSTELHPRESWPKNFVPDPEDDGCGFYHCPNCLDGMDLEHKGE